MSVTRFPKGVSTVRKSDPLGDFPLPNPFAVKCLYVQGDRLEGGRLRLTDSPTSDYDSWTGDFYDGNGWVNDGKSWNVNGNFGMWQLQSGTSGVSTGSQIIITRSFNDLGVAGIPPRNFTLDINKKAWMMCDVANLGGAGITDYEFLFGMRQFDPTTNVKTVEGPTGLYFRQANGTTDAYIAFRADEDNDDSLVMSDTFTISSNPETPTRIAAYYDGNRYVHFWLNDEPFGGGYVAEGDFSGTGTTGPRSQAWQCAVFGCLVPGGVTPRTMLTRRMLMATEW